jgi:hypothetical protein
MSVTKFELKRVVIACDAAADVGLATAAAAALAARHGATLHGIFFDDENLHRLAQLEIAAHIGLAADMPLPASGLALKEILHMRASTMRRALELAAAPHQLFWSFDQAMSPDSLRAKEGDILIIETARRPFSGRWRPRSPWLSTMARNAETLLLRRGREGRVTVVVTPRDAAICEQLVSAVFAFAERDGAVVFVSSAARIQDLAERGAESAQRLMFEPRSDEIAITLSRLAQLDPNLLVVSAEEDIAVRDALADATSCDLLIVK